MTIAISVIIPTHNPNPERLSRTLAGLSLQSYPTQRAEVIVVDNASSPPVGLASQPAPFADSVRVIREPNLGLTFARKAGLRAAQGEFVVFVDDDNVLAPNYLEQVCAAFARLPKVGALGGKSLPEFASAPPGWAGEFFPLLALRDLGAEELVSQGLRVQGSDTAVFPVFSPIGAGMALRRVAAQAWLVSESGLSDRRGAELSSAGDNDMIFTVLKGGWEVAYVPALQLTHLIPASRLDAGYLARLNHGIQKSWTQVLAIHGASPWPAIAHWTLPLRKIKAWFRYRTWCGPAEHIRWRGACGHFEGRAEPIPPVPRGN